MGAMPTPFRGADRDVEDKAPVQAEREEQRSETPPGKRVSTSEYYKNVTKHQVIQVNRSVSAAPAVTVTPKVHAPPKVPLKPGSEDLEVYGSVFGK